MNILENVTTVLSYVVLGNSLQIWLIAIVTSAICFFGIARLRVMLKKQIAHQSKFKNVELFRILRIILNSTTIMFDAAISLCVGAVFLRFPPAQSKFLSPIPFIAILIQAGYWAKSLLDYQLKNFIASKKSIDEQHQLKTLIVPIKFIALTLLWALIILAALDNMGVNVTALVAGLGIGGIAVALAVQNTLGDLLAALSIAIDRPFIVGDFIVVDEQKGHVKRIGLKTTRITSLSGEEIVLPNNNLLNSRIHNYKQMETRRIVFKFGILYQTSHDLLKQVPGLLQSIIESIEKCRFDRAHFLSFGDSSYDFEVVYFVEDPEYNVYMDIQQTINLEMVRIFKEYSIDFAYPTRTVFLSHETPVQMESLSH